MPATDQLLRFEEEHLQRFSAASFDFNPLHLSDAYARRTPFGERVVYGILGCMAGLARLIPPLGKAPAGVSIDFKSPLTLGVKYALTAKYDASGNVKASLLDGTSLATRMQLTFRDGSPGQVELPETG